MRRRTIGLLVTIALIGAACDQLGDLTDEGGAVPSADASEIPETIPEWTVELPVRPLPDDSGENPDQVSDDPLPAVRGASVSAETDVTLYVSPTAGADENQGDNGEAPLATLAAAIDRAMELRSSGSAVRIVLASGIYRERLRVAGDDDEAPALIIEAEAPGGAVITGAAEFTEWAWDEDVDAFVHGWPYDLPVSPDVEEIVGRREMVVVEGEILEQVLSVGDLTDGTFFVDGEADRIYMVPPAGSAFSSFSAEVAVRPQVMDLDGARNVLISGLVFRHAANSLDGTAVRISNSENVVYRDNDVVENNWTGLGLSTSSRITLESNVFNRNGGGGVNLFQVRDVVFDGNDTSLNNWRGVRGDYLGWSIAGVKAVGVQEILFRGHRAWNNMTRGLWLDYDVSDVAVVDSSWCHNATDGLFLEAVPGPVLVKGSEACENARYGLMIVNVYGATIEDNLICANGEEEIHFNAERGGREVESSDGVLVMTALQELAFRSNTVAGDGPLLRMSIPDEDFELALSTLDSDDNRWIVSAESGAAAFDAPPGSGDLEWWQSSTGADASSTLTQDSSLDCSEVGG